MSRMSGGDEPLPVEERFATSESNGHGFRGDQRQTRFDLINDP
jgi:hypothetical protein